jgi:hypothetical protein
MGSSGAGPLTTKASAMDVVGDELFYFAQVPVESFFQEIQWHPESRWFYRAVWA